jgi:5'-deoxynucleotidase YfbR-like HD superfamily hydrolase
MYSGSISYPNGNPTVMDIAISLCREGRYAGAGVRFWPVGLHTLVVCDLLPDPIKLDGWMHDTPECIGGDVPKPSKTDESEEREEELLHCFYKSFDIPFPSDETRRLVKEADTKALYGEIYTVGTQALQGLYPRCPEAEELVLKYVQKYTYADCLDAGGLAPIEFMRRFREYKDLAQRG